MADSLVLGDIELLGEVPSANPACAGAVFSLQPGYDTGAPQPTADFVASVLLDGERPWGRRASNREIRLLILVKGTSRDNLAAAREHLEAVADQDMWTLTWTRDRAGAAPLPLIFDCFRAGPTKVTYDLPVEAWNYCQWVELSIPALPYARSDVQERLAFASPVPAGPPPPPDPVLLDDYETISSPQCYQHAAHVAGSHSCCWDPDDDRVGDPGGTTSVFDYTRVLASSADLTSMTSVGMYLGFGSRYYHRLSYHGRHPFDVTLTLADTEGNELSFSRSHVMLPVSPVYSSPAFRPVSLRIPAGDPAFHYASVASYRLKVTNHHQHGEHYLRHVTLYANDLRAYPDSQTAVPVTRGAVYTLRGLKGTARTAMSLQLQQPPTAGTPTTLSTPGVGNFTVPAGTAWGTVAGIGGGGAGGGRSTTGVAGGGGGGEYAREDVFPMTDGQVIPYSVGAAGTDGATPADGGNTSFGPGPSSSMVVLAYGGKSVAQNATAGGAGGTGSQNSVHYDGGAGRTATGPFGGGGGSSGGSASPGGTPQGTTATSWTAAGSTNWTATFTGLVWAECWGSGGGAGTGYASGNGGGGGGGEYAAGWVPVTQGNSYSVVVGAGGAGGAGTGANGSNGNSSSFTGDGSVQVLAHGGSRGLASGGWGTGGGAGGTGSTAAVHHNGGNGGPSNPTAGGGGSSASPSGAGNSGDGYSHPGTAPTDGGAGGAGSGATSNPGGNGSAPGGGGGGTYNSSDGGDGAAGKVRLTFTGGTPDQYGAPAVTGGGAGGNGGASAGTNGSAGSQPGGGGGGADSGGAAQTGGAGGAGQIKVTPYASQAWKSLIVHRPPRGASKYFQPLVSVGAGSDVPNGSTWYTFPEPVTGTKARLSGTYSVYLIASSWNTPANSRTVTVTFRQTEYTGGQTYSQATDPVTFTPSTQITNGILKAGTVTLPVRDIPADNTAAIFQVSVTDTNTSDRFLDLILLDTMGQTVIVNEPTTGYLRYWIDAPDPSTALGRVMGSQSDRSAAVSVLANTDSLSGGPLTVEPADGENLLFAYCPDGAAPAIGVTYSPTWFFDRTDSE